MRRFGLLFSGMIVSAVVCAGASYRDVEYARPNGSPLTLDAKVPEGAGPFPAALIVHGGAWVTGDKERSVAPLFQPLEQAGYAWFSINYRLAKGRDLLSLSADAITAVNGATEDVRDAIAWLRKHAAEYHVDPNRIAIIGESAGAQLAEMAALQPEESGGVRAVVGFYGPSDLENLARTSDRIPDAIRKAVAGTPIEAFLLAGLKILSPRYAIHADAPPFLLIHGTADRLVPYQQSVDMCDALGSLMVPCELLTVKDGGHGMRWWESVAGQTAYKPILIEWLQRALR